MPSSGRAAVLDACVLIPRGLRDVLLSVAGAKAYRPVWTDQILQEVRRNGARVLIQQGLDPADAERETVSAIARMGSAFPDALLESPSWVPLVSQMTNHPGDRHVLAAAVGGGADQVVTQNLRHFPVMSRPPGVAVRRADDFLLDRLAEDPFAVVAGVEAMAARHRRPRHTPVELAQLLAGGRYTPRFGAALLHMRDVGRWIPRTEAGHHPR